MSYARKNLYANPATLYGEIPQGDEVEPVPGWGMNPAWAGPRMVGVGATEGSSWYTMVGPYPVLTKAGFDAFVADMKVNNPDVLVTLRNKKQNVIVSKNAKGGFSSSTGSEWDIGLKTFPKDWPGYAIAFLRDGELKKAVVNEAKRNPNFEAAESVVGKQTQASRAGLFAGGAVPYWIAGIGLGVVGLAAFFAKRKDERSTGK